MIAGLALGMVVAALAAGAVALTWHRYGALALGAADALADCAETRELRWRVVQHGRRDGGNVVRMRVRPRLAPLHPGLRAAA